MAADDQPEPILHLSSQPIKRMKQLHHPLRIRVVNRTTKGTPLAPQSSESDKYLAAIRLMVRKLASASTRDVLFIRRHMHYISYINHVKDKLCSIYNG
jgi:hypothetical protein